MKKTIIATVAVFLAVVGIFAFSIQYRNKKEAESISLVSTEQHTAKAEKTTAAIEENERNLIAENKEGDYQLYSDGDKVVLIHGDYRHEFTTWNWSVIQETPKLFFKDYDGDGTKELLIKVVNGITENNNVYTYALYLLKPTVTDDGTKDFKITTASTDTWKTPFEQGIKCEIIQLNCKKYIQFTMDDIYEKIVYDEKTGITQSKYAGYAKALTSIKKEYYTLDRWSKGAGIYHVDDDGNISLDIQVLVNYKEVKDTQYIGDIHCSLEMKKGVFDIVPNTIVFVAAEQYEILDPRDIAEDAWSVSISNSSKNPTSLSPEIDWIETQFDLSGNNTEISESFEGRKSEIKCVDKVEFTEGTLTLTAKDGFEFQKRMADKGAYSLTIKDDQNKDRDICYTCETKKVSGKSVLIYTFDKTYDKEDLDKAVIKFGV